MNCKYNIDPQLKNGAVNIPFNKNIIAASGLALPGMYRKTKISHGVAVSTITLSGYNGEAFSVDIFSAQKANEPMPAIIYFHGGAFCFGASPHHKKLAALYALYAECKVFLAHYHLSPKYPYPAAFEESIILYRYVAENSKSLGVDTNKICLGGDSAGGALAALAENIADKKGLPLPKSQLLIYPVTDFEDRRPSMEQYTDTPVWNSKNNQKMIEYYLQGKNYPLEESPSPIYRPISARPPITYIETAQFDCLHDQAIAYGEKLKNRGAQVIFNQTKGTYHGYDTDIASAIAHENIKKRIDFLKNSLQNDIPVKNTY